MAKGRYTAQLKIFLDQAGLSELEFFVAIGRNKDYAYLTNYIKKLIDYEKNHFFGEDSVDKEELSAKLAFARGKIAGLREMMYIIEGASEELASRLKDKK